MAQNPFTLICRKGVLSSALLIGLALGNGCGGPAAPPKWGGMSKEQWMAQREKKLQQEREEEKKAKETAEEAERKKKEAAKAAGRRRARVEPPAPPSGSAAPPQKAAKPTPNPASRTKQPAVAKKAGESALPEGFAAWTLDDYLDACFDGDARFFDAIDFLVQGAAGKEAQATDLLVKLLAAYEQEASLAEHQGDDEGPSRKALTDLKCREKMLTALVSMGTPVARRAIEERLTGPKKLDERVATAVLKQLLDRPGEENEGLVLRIVVSQEWNDASRRTLRKSGGSPKAALALVESSASESLRARLAERAVASDAPTPLFEAIWGCVEKPRLENLAAQVVFYGSNRLEEKRRRDLEKQFSAANRALLLRMMGVGSSGIGRQAADMAISASEARHAAAILWGSQVLRAVERRLQTIERLEKAEEALLLASSIPCPSLRATLLATLGKHWEEGPSALDSLTKAEDVWPEPGFLLLVKQMPRKSGKGGSAMREAGDARRGSSPKAGKLNAVVEVKQRQEEASRKWMTFSAELVQALCQQFYEAAISRPLTPDAMESEHAVPDEFPIKLRSDARVVVSYVVNWPDQLDKEFSGIQLSPLRVFYLRVEQTMRPSAILAYYRHQLPSAEEQRSEHGAWFDSLSVDKGQRSARSIDVLIHKPNKDVPILLNQEQPLLVDILVVESRGNGEESAPSSGK